MFLAERKNSKSFRRNLLSIYTVSNVVLKVAVTMPNLALIFPSAL